MKTFKDFYNYMTIICGMGTTDEEEPAVECCECGEPIYDEYPNHDWKECPICEYNIVSEEIEGDEE